MASPRKRRLLKLARAKKAAPAPEAPAAFEDTGTIHTPVVEPEPPKAKTKPVAEEVKPVAEEVKPVAAPKKTTRARKPRKTSKKEE